MATYLVKLYCLPVVDKTVKLHLCVSLDIFIDDSHQSAQGPPEKMLKDTDMAGTAFVQAPPAPARASPSRKPLTGGFCGRQDGCHFVSPSGGRWGHLRAGPGGISCATTDGGPGCRRQCDQVLLTHCKCRSLLATTRDT